MSGFNFHAIGDYGWGSIPFLAWFDQMPNVAATCTVLWFIYRGIREFRKNKKDK